MSRGFTLLEVLVAMTILALALVALLQLSAQGLRLLRLSEDYQEAVRLADHLAGGIEPAQERVVPVPEELTPAAGPPSRMYAVSVAVRWGRNRTLELVSLRTVVGAPDGTTSERAIQ